MPSTYVHFLHFWQANRTECVIFVNSYIFFFIYPKGMESSVSDWQSLCITFSFTVNFHQTKSIESKRRLLCCVAPKIERTFCSLCKCLRYFKFENDSAASTAKHNIVLCISMEKYQCFYVLIILRNNLLCT